MVPGEGLEPVLSTVESGRARAATQRSARSRPHSGTGSSTGSDRGWSRHRRLLERRSRSPARSREAYFHRQLLSRREGARRRGRDRRTFMASLSVGDAEHLKNGSSGAAGHAARARLPLQLKSAAKVLESLPVCAHVQLRTRSADAGRAAAFLMVAVARTTRLSVRFVGRIDDARQRIYFANHTSHLDFILIWSSLPRRARANATGGRPRLLGAQPVPRYYVRGVRCGPDRRPCWTPAPPWRWRAKSPEALEQMLEGLGDEHS